MPYPGEHSARLKDPKDFDPKSFRRTNGGKIYGKIKVPKTIAIIWGKLKGKSKPSDMPIPQALRFPTKSWTADKAKKWLKDNNVKYQKFEPAIKKKSKASYAKEKTKKQYTCECIECGHTLETDEHCKDVKCPKCGGQMRRKERPGPGQPAKKKEKQSMGLPLMNDEDFPLMPAVKPPKGSMSENTAPTGACVFNDNAEVMFAKDDSGEEKNRFKIIGYSGDIMKDHFYWGNLAIDLKGLSFAKKRTPVLAEHFNEMRIGVATKQQIEDKVTFEGDFLNNENARQLAEDLKDGFPMEASLFVPPTLVEQVKEGAFVEVNGKKLKGPGAVFRKAVIKEVSMCVFGADSHTSSKAYSDIDNKKVKFNFIQEKKEMDNEQDQKMTVDELTADNIEAILPVIHQEIFEKGKAEGSKEQIERFAVLQKTCGDDAALIVKCFAENMDNAQAQEALITKLSAEKEELVKKLSEQKPPDKKIDPAVSEFNNQPQGQNQPEKFEESKASDEQLKEHFEKTQDLKDQFSSAEAYIASVRHPAKT